MKTIEKIRAKLENEMGEITYGIGEPKGVYQFCEELLSFLDTLEEPEVVNNLTDDSTKAVRLPDGRYVTEKLAREIPTYKELKELALAQHNFYGLRHNEEPVSEELEKQCKMMADSLVQGLPIECAKAIPDIKECIVIAVRHGANWQKEQMMDEWLKDRDGCFWDGVNEGKKAMSEQMMKEAVEMEVGCIDDLPLQLFCLSGKERVQFLSKYKKGDKVKLIICKEDEK